MAGQYRFKDSNGNIVAQISASVGGAIAFSGSVVDFTQANNVILGNVQLAGTASNALLLDGFDSQAFAFTSSIHPFTASIAGTNTFTSSATARLNSIETISASNISRLNSIETTSASVNTLNTTQNSRLDSLEAKTGSLATTGSNTFIGTQTITGSLYISSDLIVQGSSSLQNITASAVSIGTNLINLNTANPAIRYAGLSIGDSGSIGSSGSFLYDSVQDEFIFVHRGANTTVTSSVVLMGPQTYDTIGSETYLTNNRLVKGTGNEHIVDSNISDTDTLVTINSVTSSFSGIVGIGTTSPASRLEVSDTQTTTPQFQIRETSSAYHRFGILKSGSFVHFVEPGNDGTAASEYLMTINMNGNKVGIGTSTPSVLLDVQGPASNEAKLNVIITGNWGGGSNQDHGIVVSGAKYANDTNTSLLHIKNNDNTSLFKVTDYGNVGIGTSSPSYPLDLYGVSSGTTSTLLRLKNGYNDTSTGIRARWDFASIAGAYLDVTTDSSGHKSMTLYLSSANATPSQVLTIAGSNGNLSSNGSVYTASDLYTANALRFNGSGLNASDKKLYSPVDGELQWMTHTDASARAFSISHQGTRYVYLNISGNSYLNGGNVGIGITNPTNKLQVSGNIYSTDTVFGRNLKPEAFAGPAAGSPTGATIPLGYSSMTISSLCDNNWRTIMSQIGDSKVFMWVTLGDAASKNTGYYTWQMTSPAYGVANFTNIHYMSGGWNAGGFEFAYSTANSQYILQVRTTSYYSAGNTAYGTLYFLRLE